MARPDYVFQTSTHTVRATGTRGTYSVEPGGGELVFSLERQHIPASLRSPEMERAAMAWVMARGGRTLNLDGRPVEISPRSLGRPAAGPVRRVVSIAPSNNEILHALGAMELVVGVDSGSDFPPPVRELPRLGPELSVDMEALAALRPDLVLAALSVPGMERNITALERLGLPYMVLAPLTVAGICEEIGRVGEAIGRQGPAREAVARLEEQVAGFKARGDGGEPVRVYLEWWPKPMFSPGRTCWSNELIELAGGVNVFRHLNCQSSEVTVAEVAAADPEVIFVSWCGVPHGKLDPGRVLRRQGLENISAVRDGRVYTLDESFVGRPGPRVAEGVALMAEGIARKTEGIARKTEGIARKTERIARKPEGVAGEGSAPGKIAGEGSVPGKTRVERKAAQ